MEIKEGEAKKLRTKENSNTSDGNQDLCLDHSRLSAKDQIMNLRKKYLGSILDLKHNLYVKNQDYKDLSKKLRIKTLQVSDSKRPSLEHQLKKDLFLEQSAKKQQKTQEYDLKTLKAIRETEETLGKYWKTRINDLIEVLKLKEITANEGELEECSSLKENYERNKRKCLVDFENAKYLELNAKYKDEFISNLDQSKKLQKEKSKENMSALIDKIEAEQYEQLKSLKENFKENNEETITKNAMEKIGDKNEELEHFEAELRKQAEIEKNETLEEVKEQVNKALEVKFNEIKEDVKTATIRSFDGNHEEWEEEMMLDEEYAKKAQEIETMKRNVSEKLLQGLKDRASTEMLLKKNEIFDQLNEEFYNSHEEFKKYIEDKSVRKFQEMEKKFQENFFEQIRNLSERALRPIETKLKMNYHKRLDNIKQELKTDIEKRFETQYKVLPT